VNVIKFGCLQIICKYSLTFKEAYYALHCATTTTQIKLLTLAHCSLYTSYTTSCTLSACRAMEQLSHSPISIPVPVGYASGYAATSESGHILKIRIKCITSTYCYQVFWSVIFSFYTDIILLILMYYVFLLKHVFYKYIFASTENVVNMYKCRYK